MIEMIGDFKIRKLKSDEADLNGFAPIGCMDCNNKEGIKPVLITVNREPESEEEEEKLRQRLKNDFGIESYGIFYDGKNVVITAAECPRCKSQNVFWDY